MFENSNFDAILLYNIIFYFNISSSTRWLTHNFDKRSMLFFEISIWLYLKLNVDIVWIERERSMRRKWKIISKIAKFIWTIKLTNMIKSFKMSNDEQKNNQQTRRHFRIQMLIMLFRLLNSIFRLHFMFVNRFCNISNLHFNFKSKSMIVLLWNCI